MENLEGNRSVGEEAAKDAVSRELDSLNVRRKDLEKQIENLHKDRQQYSLQGNQEMVNEATEVITLTQRDLSDVMQQVRQLREQQAGFEK